jgi:N-acetylglutamate synthase-like GNAT family acetyltransferase
MNQTTENRSSLSIRRAGSNDAESIASLFQSAYGAASHPDLNVQQLRQRLADPRNCWLVGEDADGIAATMGMIYYPHNDSYELGRAFTQPVYRRSGIALDLIQRCCQWAQQQQQGSVVFGFPRVRRIYEINPFAELRLVSEGVTSDNLEQFLHGLHLVIDECDDFILKQRITSQTPPCCHKSASG